VALARGQQHGSKKHFVVILGTTYTVSSLSNGFGDTNEKLLKIDAEMLGIPHCMHSQLMLLAFIHS
jgi:hypothetical protein